MKAESKEILVYMSIFLSIHPIYLSIYLYIHQSIYLLLVEIDELQAVIDEENQGVDNLKAESKQILVYMFIFLSIHPIYLSIYLYIHLSIYLWLVEIDEVQAVIDEQNQGVDNLKAESKQINDQIKQLMTEKEMLENKNKWTRLDTFFQVKALKIVLFKSIRNCKRRNKEILRWSLIQ